MNGGRWGIGVYLTITVIVAVILAWFVFGLVGVLAGTMTPAPFPTDYQLPLPPAVP